MANSCTPLISALRRTEAITENDGKNDDISSMEMTLRGSNSHEAENTSCVRKDDGHSSNAKQRKVSFVRRA